MAAANPISSHQHRTLLVTSSSAGNVPLASSTAYDQSRHQDHQHQYHHHLQTTTTSNGTTSALGATIPLGRHQYLQAHFDRNHPATTKSTGLIDGATNPSAAAAFLWRRNGSELDLEAKLSQEVEVGYKWLPPAPVKQGPAHYQSSHIRYQQHSSTTAPNVKPNAKMQLSSIQPRLIEVQHPKTIDHQPKASDDTVDDFCSPNGSISDRGGTGEDRNSSSVYFNDGKRRIDFVLVYEQGVRLKPVDASRVGRSFVEKEKLRQFFQENLHRDGLELEEELHKEENNAQITVYVKVHGTWPALCRQAETLKIKMPLRLRDTFAEEMNERRPSFLGRVVRKLVSVVKLLTGHGGDNGPATVSGDPILGGGTIVTWPFQRKKIDKYAINDQDTFFTPTQRMEMVWEILQKSRNDPADEKKRGIEQLLELGVYDSAFPLHDGVAGSSKRLPATEWCDRQKLRRSWASWSCMFKQQPLELIRRYYGEKIGFYFAFLGYYTSMLAFPAFVGLCTFFYGFSYSGDDALVKDICDGRNAPGNYNMCPICVPPDCEVSQLYEACNNAMWDYRMDNEATLAMACLTVIWATVFLKSWKRREAELAYEWDTYEVEQADSGIRPEYEKRAPDRRHNPVTRELEPYVPAPRRAGWISVSVLVTLLMLAGVGVSLTALVLARIALYRVFKNAGIQDSVEWARWFVHGLIFIVVWIFDQIYNWVGKKTTSMECPRSQSQWLSSFLWKVFIFELLNDFVPIAYAAWVKGKSIRTPLDLNRSSELCDSGGCMGEVTELIAVLLMARLIVGNASEIAWPIVRQFVTKRLCDSSSNNRKGIAAPNGSASSTTGVASSRSSNDGGTPEERESEGRRQWTRDWMLGELELDGVADEYMEMIVQFAFVTLFVPAFPVAPAVCLLNNILEIRVDAINFVVSHRRPLPIRVPGIQIWNNFLDIIAKVAILCNAGLISFTSEMIPRLYYKFVCNNGTNYDGFTEFSLSKIPTEAWLLHEHHRDAYDDFTSRNVTECYYQHYRTPNIEEDFPVTQRWWEIMCVRLGAFSIFIVAAFSFQWLYNFIVPDVPPHVMLKIQRRRYVVSKAMEAEMAYDKWLKSTLQGKSSVGNIANQISIAASGSPILPPRSLTPSPLISSSNGKLTAALDGDTKEEKNEVQQLLQASNGEAVVSDRAPTALSQPELSSSGRQSSQEKPDAGPMVW